MFSVSCILLEPHFIATSTLGLRACHTLELSHNTLGKDGLQTMQTDVFREAMEPLGTAHVQV